MGMGTPAEQRLVDMFFHPFFNWDDDAKLREWLRQQNPDELEQFLNFFNFQHRRDRETLGRQELARLRRAEYRQDLIGVMQTEQKGHSEPIADAEIRYRVLRTCFDLRHNNGGWVSMSDINFSPDRVDPQIVGSVCQHLADVGLIQWSPLRGAQGFVAGRAKITGEGVAAIEANRSDKIDIRFPRGSAGVAGMPATPDDAPLSEIALTDIQDAVSTIKAELPALMLSNSDNAEVVADLNHIEVEAERPEPRRRFMKLYLESLRDNLAKAAGAGSAAGLVALVTLVGGLLAKHFGLF